MNVDRVYEILGETTQVFRKGEVLTQENRGGIQVTTIMGYPHESTTHPDLEKVDMHFVTVAVQKDKATEHRDELVGLLNDYPLEPNGLSRGPSYIHIGGVLGSQEAAFRLMALGKVLGFWDVITPATFHTEGADADRMAGAGFIMVNGYHP